MHIVARAPGKVVVLGEYAVLGGAPALVIAVARRAHAELRAGEGARCRLETWSPELREHRFSPGERSGVALVDQVLASVDDAERLPPWHGVLDSRALYHGRAKLGMGSSAAALCAWAGAWSVYARRCGIEQPPPDMPRLVALHRALQGGAGSGLDAAACLTGGTISYRLVDGTDPRVGSVRLPNGVGFAGIFAGRSASTPGLVASFKGWTAAHPREAGRRLRALSDLAEAGDVAAGENDTRGFLEAVAQYGQQLGSLGVAIGADIVTAEHRDIGQEARRHGVVYKVSGAGGGDLGLALSSDPQALDAFKQAVANKNYHVIDLDLDEQGLVVEERA